MAYYYLIAGLPMLTLGEPPPITTADFATRCREQLSAADLLELRAVQAGEGASDFAARWRAFEANLGNALVRARAARLQVDPTPWLRPGETWDSDILEEVEEAYALADPLERELALDRFRWARLDDLAVGHFFDLQALLIYAKRLSFCERWLGFDANKGRARLDAFLGKGKAVS